MRIVNAITLLGSAALLANCSQPAQNEAAPEGGDDGATVAVAKAALADADGNAIGDVTLVRSGEMLSLELQLQGIEAGEKAFHLHGTGLCEGPDFTSAGGHLNPFGKSHGSKSENGQHLGDFPNIIFTEEGAVQVSYALDGQADALLPTIFDEDGTAVMIHAGPDDYTTDPAGNAGPRVACGVLTSAE